MIVCHRGRMRAIEPGIMRRTSTAARIRSAVVSRPSGKSLHVLQEEAMKLDPFVIVPSRCDDVHAIRAVGPFGTPGAAIEAGEETGSQFLHLQVLLSSRPVRIPQELHGTISCRGEPVRVRPGTPVASRSGASVPIFFATFVDAQHESRRCQAAREIRRYHHTVEEARAYEVRRRRG